MSDTPKPEPYVRGSDPNRTLRDLYSSPDPLPTRLQKLPRQDCGNDPRLNPRLPMGLPDGANRQTTKWTIGADVYTALKRDAARLDWLQVAGRIELDSQDGDIRCTIDFLMQHDPSPGQVDSEGVQAILSCAVPVES